RAALEQARAIDAIGDRFAEAVSEGRETVRLAPARRGAARAIEVFAAAATHVDLAVRNVRVLARGTIRALELDENVPPEAPDAIDDLAAAVEALRGALDEGGRLDAVREPALRAAATATQVLERTGNLSVSVIVGQVRSTAVDLLAGAGLSTEDAVAA